MAGFVVLQSSRDAEEGEYIVFLLYEGLVSGGLKLVYGLVNVPTRDEFVMHRRVMAVFAVLPTSRDTEEGRRIFTEREIVG